MASSWATMPSVEHICLMRRVIDSGFNGLKRNLAHRDAIGSIMRVT